jgi:hypothetical protein
LDCRRIVAGVPGAFETAPWGYHPEEIASFLPVYITRRSLLIAWGKLSITPTEVTFHREMGRLPHRYLVVRLNALDRVEVYERPRRGQPGRGQPGLVFFAKDGTDEKFVISRQLQKRESPDDLAGELNRHIKAAH